MAPFLDNRIEGGDKNEGDQHRGQQAADNDAGHGRLHFASCPDSESHRQECQSGCKGRHENGPKASSAANCDGFNEWHFVGPLKHVDVVDQNDGVIDYDPCEHDDTQK